MAEERIFGVPISTELTKQIGYRASLLKKKEGRTTEDIQYLTTDTSWVSLASSINIQSELTPEQAAYVAREENFSNQPGGLTPEANERLSKFDGDNTLAANNVLRGGVLYGKNLSTGQILLTKREGINFTGVDDSNSYSNYSSIGIRPQPGITSVNIICLNRYGSLKKASVNFQCWSIEQLDVLEKLYMRPGYTVLLEWGHSFYINKDGKKEQRVRTATPDFFNKGRNKQAIQNTIDDLKQESGYNYDGMLGRVTNFSWQLRTDGGYDCSIELVSIGEIMESLQALLSPAAASLVALQNGTPADRVRNSPTALISLFNTINTSTSKEDIATNLNIILKSSVSKLSSQDIPIFFSFPYTGLNQTDTTANKSIDRLRFIRLQNLLYLVNKVLLFESDGATNITEFDVTLGVSKYLTFDHHFSNNPGIAVLPYVNDGLPHGNETLELQDYIQDESVGTTDDVLNLGINVGFILGLLQEMLTKKSVSGDTKQSVYDFIKQVLDGVNSAFGGINSLDLHYEQDKRGFKWYVVDRSISPSLGSSPKDVTVDITGLGSFATNITLKSELSSEISNMMALAASARSQDISSTLEGFYRYNLGYIDRISPDKKPLSLAGIRGGDEWKSVNESYNNIKEIYKPYLKEKNGNFNIEDFQSISSIHSEWTNYKFRVTRGQKRAKGSSQPYSGIIPFTLQLTLHGIAGVKRGEAFKVNKGILPPRYDSLVGFVVTGVEHTVENNQWYTNINAQTFILEDKVPTTYIPSEPKKQSTEDQSEDSIESTLILSTPVFPLTTRSDNQGVGRFGVGRRRASGAGQHNGWDLVAIPGTPVYAPIDGEVYVGNAYSNYQDQLKYPGLKSVSIIGTGIYSGYKVLFSYVDLVPSIKEGQKVNAGNQVGIAQQMSTFYGVGMTNHVHFEIKKDGIYKNPELFKYS